LVDIGGIVDYHCLNLRKQKKVEKVMIDNSTNINKTKESLNSDGQQFHQYQQNKRKVKQ
jgi:hypothetical protein